MDAYLPAVRKADIANVVSGSQHIIQVTAGRHVFTPSIDAITPNNDPFTYDWTADPE